MDQPPTPARPLWLTAMMVAIGVVGAPMAILGIALALNAADVSDSTGVIGSYLGFVALSIVASVTRVARPLGVGMLLGSLALALMFLATGGTSNG